MDLEKKAIDRIRYASEMSLHHYGKPLVCTYSGGKDSDVILELFRRSGIPFEVHNSHTTADAPPTVRHIREVFKNLELDGVKCEIEMPTYQGKRISMWSLIPIKLMPPTRTIRYCCSVLKEASCGNRFVATGVRWDESTARASSRNEFEKIGSSKATKEKYSTVMLMNDNDAKRRMNEHCMQKKRWLLIRLLTGKTRMCGSIYTQNIYQRVSCINADMIVLAVSAVRLRERRDTRNLQTFQRTRDYTFQHLEE